MIYEQFNLKDRVEEIKKDSLVHAYCVDNFDEYSKDVKRKTIIVLPGGGYEYCSHRENEPVAIALLANDFNVFCLEYSVREEIEFPYPMIEVYALIKYIRENKDKYNVDINNIYVLGFSAGGHLCASACTYWNDKQFADFLHCTNEEIKINGCLLGYPVITADLERTHVGSIKWITENYKPELVKFFNLNERITKDFPRTYIYDTDDDTCVPSYNSKVLTKVLQDKGIEVFLDMYPHGVHGSSLCTKNVYYNIMPQAAIDDISKNKSWFSHMVEFINK